MSRKLGIIISLVLALIFTLLIVGAANKKYAQATKTVEVVQATQFIPYGEKLTAGNTKTVKVVKSAAKGLAGPEDIKGKTAKVSMIKGQYVYKESLDTAEPLRPGYVEVFIPVDLSSSAYALAGQRVNVHIINKENGTAPAVLKNVRVLHCLDNQGEPVGDGGNVITKAAARKNEPASVGLEIPADKAEMVVHAASAKLIYLTRTGGR